MVLLDFMLVEIIPILFFQEVQMKYTYVQLDYATEDQILVMRSKEDHYLKVFQTTFK